jgi:hypothetical protein
MTRATNAEGMGGFKDIRYAEEALSARSYGAALLAAAQAWGPTSVSRRRRRPSATPCRIASS